MGKGLAYAFMACFVWGLIFVVPDFMPAFSSLEVALGRYLVYGLLSLSVFLRSRLRGNGRYPRYIWQNAALCSFFSTIIYYSSVVMGSRYATPAICALILGMSPITISFYGNWRERECDFKYLLFPSCLIIIGLTLINVPHLFTVDAPSQYILGLTFSFVALASWTWYCVTNAKFLKDHPQLKAYDWTTLVGVTALGWTMITAPLAALAAFASNLEFDGTRYFSLNEELIRFLLGSCVLGIFCSWVGSLFWNKASFHLPVSLAGQLTLFETLFGLLFVYTLAQEWPPQLECIGMVLLLGAVVYAVTLPRGRTLQHS